MATHLRIGYSRTVIGLNINAMVNEGMPRNAAIRHAFNAARMSFFKKYPDGALPASLAFPKTRRVAKYYAPNGAPIDDTVRANPVRALDMSDAERDRIAQDVDQQFAGRGKKLRQAAALYTDFTGHEDPQLDKVSVPGMPDVALAIGQVDGIMYTTVRDGRTEKYIHRFKKQSQPLLCSSPDGKQLIMIGGSYDFTDRGIVDA